MCVRETLTCPSSRCSKAHRRGRPNRRGKEFFKFWANACDLAGKQVPSGHRETILTAVLAWELEDHCDLRLNVDGLAVEQVGFIFPLFNRIRGGVGELRRPTEYFHRSDVARF